MNFLLLVLSVIIVISIILVIIGSIKNSARLVAGSMSLAESGGFYGSR